MVRKAARVNRAIALRLILNDYITKHSGQRVRLEDLRLEATHADPSLLGDPTARSRILAALTELETEGVIAFPRSPKHYDDRSLPSLPLWVTKPPRAHRQPPIARQTGVAAGPGKGRHLRRPARRGGLAQSGR